MARRRTYKHRQLLVPALGLGAGFVVLVGVALFLQIGLGGEQSAAVVESEIVALTNTERTDNNVPQLTENPVLDEAAQARAEDMAKKGYFSHTAPDGSLPWVWFDKFGYDYHYAGENLAVRFSDSGEVVNAWMASPTHRENIVKSDYTEIGVGVADGTYEGQPTTFVVQFFGTPQISTTARVTTSGYGDLPASKSPEVASPSLGKPPPVATRASVAGAETSAPTQRSVFAVVMNFLTGAWRTLTASAVESGSIDIGIGASTAR